MAAEDLAEFRGDGVGCSFGECGKAESESRYSIGHDAAGMDPTVIDQPELYERIRDEGGDAEVGSDLRSFATCAAFGGAKSLFVFVADAGGEGSKEEDGKDGDESGLPWQVREAGGSEHHAGGDGHSCEGCSGSRGTYFVGDESEESAEAEGPDGDLWCVRQPPAGFEYDICPDCGKDEEQHGFGLPQEVFAGHGFIVPGDTVLSHIPTSGMWGT